MRGLSYVPLRGFELGKRRWSLTMKEGMGSCSTGMWSASLKSMPILWNAASCQNCTLGLRSRKTVFCKSFQSRSFTSNIRGLIHMSFRYWLGNRWRKNLYGSKLWRKHRQICLQRSGKYTWIELILTMRLCMTKVSYITLDSTIQFEVLCLIRFLTPFTIRWNLIVGIK